MKQVQANAQEKFWIIKGAALAKNVTQRCVICRKLYAKPKTQLMADLPLERLEANKPPFTNTGIDYFGPIEVKQGRSMVKRYGVIFTCLVSRAVHFEIAYSLTTDSFLGVFSRFIARRGRPTVVFSDNGTNLTSAEKELRRLIDSFNQEQINMHLTQNQIEWKFLPPYASHMAGACERLIQSTKRILRALIRQQTLTDESLHCFIVEVERILNDRPLTSPNDPCEPSITPAMLLQGRCTISLPAGNFDKKDAYSRRWWRQVQYISDVFWKRWIKEYLPTLQRRSKWNQVRESLKQGDLVLVVDETVPRGQWPTGIIQSVKESKDGLVRSAVVKTAKGMKERPITNIVVLEDQATG